MRRFFILFRLLGIKEPRAFYIVICSTFNFTCIIYFVKNKLALMPTYMLYQLILISNIGEISL